MIELFLSFITLFLFFGLFVGIFGVIEELTNYVRKKFDK